MLTFAHVDAMKKIGSRGADVFDYGIACLLREVQKEKPELIDIGPTPNDYPGEQRQPYFGAMLTAKGSRYVSRHWKKLSNG